MSRPFDIGVSCNVNVGPSCLILGSPWSVPNGSTEIYEGCGQNPIKFVCYASTDSIAQACHHVVLMDNPYEQQQTALVSRIINNVVKFLDSRLILGKTQ
jgi:hypothetical protein